MDLTSRDQRLTLNRHNMVTVLVGLHRYIDLNYYFISCSDFVKYVLDTKIKFFCIISEKIKIPKLLLQNMLLGLVLSAENNLFPLSHRTPHLIL